MTDIEEYREKLSTKIFIKYKDGKTCNTCKKIQPIVLFRLSKYKYGYTLKYQCKICQEKYLKKI